ncbi:MAG TPA: VWA domain-containing protein [Bryobacteraceae bacterium]|nr:VWA domain-containing protein [Bryobacteraceae bacterium]
MRLLAASLALLAYAQDATIRTKVPLVSLSVSVTDAKGQPINGLQPEDFILLDNGKLRAVRVDTVDEGLAPVALVVLVQTTAMSLSALAKIRKVGAMIPEAVLGANGEAAVVTYDDELKVAQDFTNDADAIAATFKHLEPQDSSGGRMIDAVDQALHMIAARSGSRRAYIVIIGENKDRGSKEKLGDLLPKLQRSGATVYNVTYSAYLTPFTTRPEDYQPTGGSPSYIEFARLFKQNTAAALTETSGGRKFGFETKSKLEKDLMALGADLHSRYLLSFTPDENADGRFHSLEVHIRGRDDARVRTRSGYFAIR